MSGRTEMMSFYDELVLVVEGEDFEEIFCEYGDYVWMEVDSDFEGCVFGYSKVASVES
jgi:hypothetical protein